MQSLLGHGEAVEISLLQCAFKRGCTELQDARYRVRDAAFCPEVFGREVDAGLPVKLVGRQPGICFVQGESLQFNSSPARSLLQGFYDARRHVAVLLSGLLSQSESGPLLQKARLGTWESSPFA